MSVVNTEKLNTFFELLEEDLDAITFKNQGIAAQFAASHLKVRARKKARFPRPDLDAAAKADFVSFNQSLQGFHHSLPNDIVTEARYFIETSLWNATSSLDPWWVQKSLSIGVLFDLWGFGPGASNEVPWTHPVDKMYASWSCTDPCKPLVYQLRRNHAYLNFFDEVAGLHVHSARGSQLLTVPKNQEKVRTIAKEPLGNMCIQLAAGRYLSHALLLRGCDISCQQPRNRALAKLGSVDGSLATLDLSSASDCITPSLVEALFPDEWFDLLTSIRSPEISSDGVWYKLNMISTMGNGYTFPLMTLIIVSLIYAMRRVHGGPNLFVNWSNTAVFGDDIVIPVSEVSELVKLLKDAGFIVNLDKSYFSGPFRESCGGDYYRGVDVSPFYVKSLATDSDVNVALNQTLSWQSRHDLVLPRSSRFLLSLLTKVRLVPEWYQPYSGVWCQSVPKRIRYLQVVQPKKPANLGFLETPLCCGGYLLSGPKSNSYIPRQFKTRYTTRVSRLPKGFLDGWDPTLRSRLESNRCLFLLKLLDVKALTAAT